jgi:serine/threonine protein kinase
VDGRSLPTIKVADFGLARHLSVESGFEAHETKSNIGPIKWMSPEAILHRISSPASDVFSLGMVLIEGLLVRLFVLLASVSIFVAQEFECCCFVFVSLTPRHLLKRAEPWPELSPFHVAIEVGQKEAMHPIPENASPELSGFIRRCLAFDAEDRPTATNAAKELGRLAKRKA